ncbi:MAG TPA: CHC2 zinc finger domain-containing protein [Steroidobacteraceae bacterium]|jgi:DNA primase catalytic core
MARIPEHEIEQLKQQVSLIRLIEADGIALKKQGKDYAGRCPFHEDATPSLIVTPTKNLYHCFGCNAAGGPIDWVMQRRGMSFRHAVETLRTELGLIDAPIVITARTPAAFTLAAEADRQTLLRQVLTYYQETLTQSPEAMAYLAKRGLAHPELITRFRLGYANRTLGYRLPDKQLKAGAEQRGRLQAIGLLRDSGHEHFNGSLIVPVIGAEGTIHELYGRKIRDDLRTGTAYHLYLPGPHAGVWNEEGLAASGGEVILCEALIDAMTFWVHGFRNVTASYGVHGFTEDHLAAFQRYGIRRVLIAYDRDDAGNRAAEALAATLATHGIGSYRVRFPKGMDANAYALAMNPPAKALALAIRKAEWLGEGQASSPTSVPREGLEAIALVAPPPDDPHLAAAVPAPVSAVSLPEPTLATPQPPVPVDDVATQEGDHDLILTLGDRRYRVRGWKKPLNPEALKVNLLVSRGERFHVDTLDLYQAKARAAFTKQAGLELGEAEDVLKHDLGRVLLKLEAVQTEQLTAALAKEDKQPKLSDSEHAEALALLKAPDLLDRIVADFTACGVVGEATNTLVGYIAAVSRQLDRPLAVIIQSSSAAGKSALMDAVLALMPEEAQVRYSAMTGQSLFYMGETNLKHKILAIAEEEGASNASYALKLLQSEGQVTIASTGKDPTTGLLVTHEYRVEGPVMLFLTTTAIDIDEELLNRCLVLTVNESREQTRAIHAQQRHRQTLDGLLATTDREAILAVHRNAQGLLQPLAVVNPHADRLTFLDDQTRTRRDHMKYLSLIRAITLLHQYQRPLHTVPHRGKELRYIEVLPSDIAVANRLANEVLGRTLDELPPQTRVLLQRVHRWVADECERLAVSRADLRFTRRQVRALTGWGDTQLKIHLGRLAELEYVLIHRVHRGQGFAYELLYDGEGERGERFLMGLTTTDTATTPVYDGERSGDNEQRSGRGRAAVGRSSGRGRRVADPVKPSTDAGSDDAAGDAITTAPREGLSIYGSYPVASLLAVVE